MPTEEKPILIVGLGNPGPNYCNTRHNAGFLVIDRLLEKAGPVLNQSQQCHSELYTVRYEGRILYLAKPLTFMNLSGQAVSALLDRLGLENLSEVLVICDCLDLPLGRLRLRKTGSSGGQRGIESIIGILGSNQFPRLRVGIGRADTDVVDHVLGQWSSEESEQAGRVIDAAADAALKTVSSGVTAAMNIYNGLTVGEM